jgi:hypothetical protein
MLKNLLLFITILAIGYSCTRQEPDYRITAHRYVRVFDIETHKPIANATVYLMIEPPNKFWGIVDSFITDSTGIFPITYETLLTQRSGVKVKHPLFFDNNINYSPVHDTFKAAVYPKGFLKVHLKDELPYSVYDTVFWYGVGRMYGHPIDTTFVEEIWKPNEGGHFSLWGYIKNKQQVSGDSRDYECRPFDTTYQEIKF